MNNDLHEDNQWNTRKDNKMNINIRDVAIAVGMMGVAVGSFYLLFEVKDYKHEHEWERQYLLEDRKVADEVRKTSLVELRSCYQNAEESYTSNWAKACRSWNDHKLNECLISGVPENTCRSKFVPEAACELPSNKADRAETYRDQLKAECRSMYVLQMAGLEHRCEDCQVKGGK